MRIGPKVVLDVASALATLSSQSRKLIPFRDQAMKDRVQNNCCLLVALLFTMSADAADLQQPTIETTEPSSSMCRCVGELAPVNVRIIQTLASPLKPSGLEFQEEPLENVVNFLQTEYGIPIQIDEPALTDAGFTLDEPLTIKLANTSLRSALRLLLKQKDLTYVLRNEVMLITTPETAESRRMTCLYDVRDLRKAMPPPTAPAGASAWADYDSLVGALTECVSPETWTEHGGKGEVRSIHAGLLVVYQTQQVHAEIGELLDAVRKTLGLPIERLDARPHEIAPSGPAVREDVQLNDSRPRRAQVEPVLTDENPFE